MANKKSFVETLPSGYVLVTKKYYYIRTQATQFSDILGHAKPGEKIPYLGEESRGWLKVHFDGKIGWLYKQAGKLVLVAQKKLTIKKGKWHVRSAPGLLYGSLGTVNGGDQLVDQGETRKNYRLVIFNNQNGWIPTRAIEKE